MDLLAKRLEQLLLSFLQTWQKPLTALRIEREVQKVA